MRIWASLIYSRSYTGLATRLSPGINTGKVTGTRWEWGFGKGQWKRRVRAIARELGMEGRVRAAYFVIGSRYSVEYVGTKDAATVLYEEIR